MYEKMLSLGSFWKEGRLEIRKQEAKSRKVLSSAQAFPGREKES